ncbi:MAG: hypothetical protein K0U12_01510, partial [Gammaproteobacteria bacterium]|nr:hypothetical protein [Gammaproteobacteria bacterium]
DISVVQPLTVAWVLALPFFDLTQVVVSRLRKGCSPLRAGRDHIHHILQAVGFSAMSSTLTIALISVGLGVIGVLLNHYHVLEGIQLGLFLGIFIVYLASLRLLSRHYGRHTSLTQEAV